MKKFYVYLITNQITGKKYIGSRLNYSNSAKDDILYMGSSKNLKKDISLQGSENFSKEIIKEDICNTIGEVLRIESSYILKYNTLYPEGYNKILPDKFPKFHKAGYKLSKETKEKITKANRGKTHSEKTKEKISKANKGRVLSDDTKEKMKGPKSEKTKENMSSAAKNKNKSEKHRNNISKSKKGKNHPNWGKSLTKETKEKIGKANRKIESL